MLHGTRGCWRCLGPSESPEVTGTPSPGGAGPSPRVHSPEWVPSTSPLLGSALSALARLARGTAQRIGISSVPRNPGGKPHAADLGTIKGGNKTSRKTKEIFFYLSKKYFCLSTERFCILFDFVSLSADVLVSELEKKYYNYKFVNESLL